MSQTGCMRRWRDVGEGDIKIFLVHMIAMGLVQKTCLDVDYKGLCGWLGIRNNHFFPLWA